MLRQRLTQLTWSDRSRLISLKDVVRTSRVPFRGGSSCDVFIGEHPLLGKVALKRYRLDDKGYPPSKRRQFRREADYWRQLEHPNLLPFHGAVEEGGYMYLVSPWVTNGTLPEYLKKHPDADRPSLITQVAAGVHYLHSVGIVHGDLKGDNIFISEDLSALISDFGLSKMAADATSESLKGAGSVRWMSPEVLNEGPRTYGSDVYSFGIVIAEILSSRLPYHQYQHSVSVALAVLRGERPSKYPLTSVDGQPYEELWIIAALCWNEAAPTRPAMATILQALGRMDVGRPQLRRFVQLPVQRKGPRLFSFKVVG